MPRLSKFRFRRGKNRPRGEGSEPLPEPPVSGGMTLMYTDAELPTIRTQIQSGHTKPAFQLSLNHLGTVLARSAPTPPTKGNYYSEDSTILATFICDICALDPEHTSWASAGITFPTPINTRAKCATLAYNLWAYSTRIGDVTDSLGRTAKDLLSLMAAGNQTTFSDGDLTHPPHLWRHPSQRVSSIFYIIDKCWDVLTAPQRADLATAALHVLNVGLANLPGTGSLYPQITAESGWNNQSFSYHRALTATGIMTLLGRGITTPTEDENIAKIELRMRGRTREELNMYVRQGVGAPGLHESSGAGYAGDDMCGLSRIALWNRPIPGWDSIGLQQWMQTAPETMIREMLPGCWGVAPPLRPYSIPYGTLSGGHSYLNELPPEEMMVLAALSRYGFMEEAGHFKWAFEQNNVSFTTYGTNTILAEVANTDRYKVAHHWYMLAGRMAEVESVPMTAFTTSKSSLGFRVWNNLFDAPSHSADPSRILYFFACPDSRYYGHAGIEWLVGKTQLWAYGGYVYRSTIGTGKSGFGNNGTQNAQPIILTNDRQVRTLANLAGHPDTQCNNKASAFTEIGRKYADDPDHAEGGYVGYVSFFWHTNLVPANQNQTEVFSFMDEKFFVEFYRWSVTNPATYRLLIPKITPTKPTFLDGAGEVKTHPGRWVSDGGRTLELVNDSGGAFSAKHYNETQWWPDAHVKAIISWRATHALEIQVRGWDASYVKGAYRDGLDHQHEGTRIDERIGRNTRERVRGNAACFTRADVIGGVAANRRVYLSSYVDMNGTNQPVTADVLAAYAVTRLYYGNGISTPTVVNISSIDTTTTPISLVVASNVSIPEGSPLNYSLLTSTQAELGAEVEPGVADPAQNAVNFRRIMGGWNIWACPPEGSAPTRNEIFCVTQVGDSRDGGFVAATVTQYDETDVTHVEIGAPGNLAVVVGRAHPSISNPAGWLAGYDFLLHRATCKVTCVNLAPGSAYQITSVAEGPNYRITLTPSGGARVVNSAGRITFNVSGGVIV
jgi:hypothetical protein